MLTVLKLKVTYDTSLTSSDSFQQKPTIDILNLQHRRLAGKMMEVENNVAEHFEGESMFVWKYLTAIICDLFLIINYW